MPLREVRVSKLKYREETYARGDHVYLPTHLIEALGDQTAPVEAAESAPAGDEPVSDPSPQPAGEDAGDGDSDDVDRLRALADEYGVDLGRASTSDGIRRKLTDAGVDPDE